MTDQQARPNQQMKKVGNYFINMETKLGQGQYGTVYLAHEMVPQKPDQDPDIVRGEVGYNLFACKVVERQNLDQKKEMLVQTEICNQDAVQSLYVTKMKKAIKTDSRYYILMEFCNGNDLKELMELRHWKLPPAVTQLIIAQLVKGFSDMIDVLIVHRDLKLQNIMLNFPGKNE